MKKKTSKIAVPSDMLGANQKEEEKNQSRSRTTATSPNRKEPDLSILNP